MSCGDYHGEGSWFRVRCGDHDLDKQNTGGTAAADDADDEDDARVGSLCIEAIHVVAITEDAHVLEVVIVGCW